MYHISFFGYGGDAVYVHVTSLDRRDFTVTGTEANACGQMTCNSQRVLRFYVITRKVLRGPPTHTFSLGITSTYVRSPLLEVSLVGRGFTVQFCLVARALGRTDVGSSSGCGCSSPVVV